MDDTIRILMVVPNLRVSNGVASFAMNYYRELNHANVHMDFVVYSNIESPYIKEIESYGDSVIVIPPISNLIAHLKVCRNIFKNRKYDIIHDNSLLITYPLMRVAKKHVNVRILHSHNTVLGETVVKERRNKIFIRMLVDLATNYAACSKLAGQALFGDANCIYIPNIVPEKRVTFSQEKRRAIRKKMEVDSKIVVGSIGRVAAQKNPLFALDIIKEVSQRNPKIEYWWIGSGPMDEEVKAGIAERGLCEHVRFWGSREDVSDLLQAIDLFFLPSIFEGLPISGIEAQAIGLPSVISSSVTKELAYTDIVEYVPLEASVEQWADVLEKQITRIPERCSHIEDLRNSPFSQRNAGKNLTELYKSLIEKQS